MVGKYELQVLFAVFVDAGGVGDDFHAVLYRVNAGCLEFFFALDLYKAHSAAA